MGSEIDYGEGCSSSIIKNCVYKEEDDLLVEPYCSELFDTSSSSSCLIVENRLAIYKVGEIPPFHQRTLSGLKATREQQMLLKLENLSDMEFEKRLGKMMANRRKYIAGAKAYKLFTEEEIEKLPIELVPRMFQKEPEITVIEENIPIEQTDDQERIRIIRNRTFREFIRNRTNYFRNFIRRITRAMFHFIDNYAPPVNQYFRRNDEEDVEFETRKRIIIPDEERLQIHLLYMRQMERANRKPAPPIPSHTGTKIKPTQEYKDFVMYKDLEPLIKLKNVREEEAELNRKVVDSRVALEKIVAEIKLRKDLGDNGDNDSDIESMTNYPLLPKNQSKTAKF